MLINRINLKNKVQLFHAQKSENPALDSDSMIQHTKSGLNYDCEPLFANATLFTAVFRNLYTASSFILLIIRLNDKLFRCV